MSLVALARNFILSEKFYNEPNKDQLKLLARGERRLNLLVRTARRLKFLVRAARRLNVIGKLFSVAIVMSL